MTTQPLVRLVTAAHLPHLVVDDQELFHELRRRDVPVEVAVWDDPDVDWSLAPVTVIRSVFDYHLRRDEFISWLDRVELLTAVSNAPEIIRWNSHKSYLKRVAEAGFPTIETEWLEQGQDVDLAAILERRGWAGKPAVVKPAVSASAYQTLRVEPNDVAAGQEHAVRLLKDGDALVQSYLHDFDTVGETALIWLGDRQTHAVWRPSGISSTLEEAHVGRQLQPAADELELAHAAHAWILPRPLYARIDLIRTEEHGLLVLELELVEPALYLRHSRDYTAAFADAVIAEIPR